MKHVRVTPVTTRRKQEKEDKEGTHTVEILDLRKITMSWEELIELMREFAVKRVLLLDNVRIKDISTATPLPETFYEGEIHVWSYLTPEQVRDTQICTAFDGYQEFMEEAEKAGAKLQWHLCFDVNTPVVGDNFVNSFRAFQSALEEKNFRLILSLDDRLKELLLIPDRLHTIFPIDQGYTPDAIFWEEFEEIERKLGNATTQK